MTLGDPRTSGKHGFRISKMVRSRLFLTLLTAKIKIVDAIIFLVAISAFDQVRSNTIPVFYIANFF